MINDQLLDYIKKQLSSGVSRETITHNLKGADWTDADLSEAFKAITPPPASTPASSIPVAPVAPIAPVTPSVPPNVTGMQTGLPVTTHTKSKKILTIVGILVLLGIAGAGAYAYYSGVFTTLDSLIPQALDKTQTITSATYDVTANVNFSELKDAVSGLPSLGIDSTKLGFTVEGSYDKSNPDNLKSVAVVSLNLSLLSVKAESRMIDNIIYFSLVQAPALSFVPVDVSSFTGKWFSIPVTGENNSFDTFSGVDTDVTEKITPEQKDRLYQMVKDAHFIKQTAKLSSETIGGEPSYHFAFNLDRAGISAYLQSLKSYINTIGKDDSQMSLFDPTSISKQFENLKDFQGEIWIGKNDKLLHKVAVSFGIQPDLTKEEKIKVNMVIIFSGYNQPVSIIAPEESTPFMELMSGMMGGLMDVKQNGDDASVILDQLEEARQKGKEAQIKALMSSLRAYAELFWDQNNTNGYLGFCLSEKLKEIRESVEASGGTRFICKDSSTKYAVGVKLFNDGENWCTDSTGTNKLTITLPSGTACPAK